MRIPVLLAAIAVSGAAASAQGLAGHVLYYKFDTGTGSEVINYGGASGAPGDGTIQRMPANAASWVQGRFRRGLSGSDSSSSSDYCYVRTGWGGPLTGSFTIAWFQRQSGNNAPTGTSYVISDLGSFRIFTGGVAQTGLRMSAWGGQPSSLNLTVDVQSASASAWVHIAIVVDTTAMTATWYVDGTAQPSIPLTSTTTNLTGSDMVVGKHNFDSTSYQYDLDEFRLCDFAATPTQIRTWATLTSAADGRYGMGCTANLGSQNGPPALGTANYQLTLATVPLSAYLLSIGSSRTLLNFDLAALHPSLAGCRWESDLLVQLPGATDGQGDAVVPLPIPSNASFIGIALYNQALIFPSRGAPQSSNGVAVQVRRQ